jgi:hypothetical protein
MNRYYLSLIILLNSLSVVLNVVLFESTFFAATSAGAILTLIIIGLMSQEE